jgi:subtilase-type serine protease
VGAPARTRKAAVGRHSCPNVPDVETLGGAFQAAPASTFTISGVPLARDSLLAEAGLDLAITSYATVGVSHVGEVANNVQAEGVRLRSNGL